MHDAQSSREILTLFVLAEPVLHVVELLDGLLALVDVTTFVEVQVNVVLDRSRVDQWVSAGLFPILVVVIGEFFFEVPQSFLHIFGLL